MRGNDERRVPVPARRRPALLFLRLNADAFAGALVVAHEDAVLQLGVDRVGILGIDPRDETVAALGDEPVLVQDAVLRSGARRSAERIVVLQPAVDVVERHRVVHVHVVVLRERQVLEEHPGRRAIERTVEPAVVADHHVVRIRRIDPDDVVVDVHVSLSQRVHRLAAVVGHLKDHVGNVDAVDVLRIGVDVAVVHRAGVVLRALLPGDAVVGGAEDAALTIGRLHVRVEDVGLHGRDGEPDPAELFVRQADGDLLPGLAAVGAAMDRALGSAVDEGGKRAAALV